jgi:hypothetical protein
LIQKLWVEPAADVVREDGQRRLRGGAIVT